jgi:hypothetical protein
MTSKALGDVRSTSYNAATAQVAPYVGTIDDAITQIRSEPDEVRAPWTLNISRERYELLKFLGVTRPSFEMSGIQQPNDPARLPRSHVTPSNEDDTVVYGAPEQPPELSPYSLEYAKAMWPRNFTQ